MVKKAIIFFHFSCLQGRKQTVISRVSKGKQLGPYNEHSALIVKAAYGMQAMGVRRGLELLSVENVVMGMYKPMNINDKITVRQQDCLE